VQEVSNFLSCSLLCKKSNFASVTRFVIFSCSRFFISNFADMQAFLLKKQQFF